MDIDPDLGGAVGDARHELGRNGRLARDHQYISAVAILSERERAADFCDQMNRRYADLPADARWERIEDAISRGERPSGSYHRVRVFKTLSPSAAPLPEAFFHGPHDELFEPNEEGYGVTYKYAARRMGRLTLDRPGREPQNGRPIFWIPQHPLSPVRANPLALQRPI
jgi:hypothetical protein